MTTQSPPFRLLPAVDRLLRLQEGKPVALAKEAAHRLVAELRERMARDWPPPGGEDSLLGEDALRARLIALCAELEAPVHRRVINATGILLHTGLGRAPLCQRAIAAMAAVAGQGYVEVDATSGKRNRREMAVAAHLVALTGAEAAMVVNNNAAATLLALDAMARGKQVIVSRGELVEIGGGFRMPDVMRQAGCQLVEVGTTNRTRPRDYEAAIGPETGCLLKVHPSNYRIEGFTEEATLPELVALGRRRGLPVLEDLGSGLLLDEPLPHDAREPSVRKSVASGADLVFFSGDKLLGACQAGILVGSQPAIARVSAHPLYRALRQSKLELAALEATLLAYRWGDPKREIPVLRAIFASDHELRAQGQRLLEAVRAGLSARGLAAELVASQAYLGSGASPARAMASVALAIGPSQGLESLAQALRQGEPAVFPRLEADRLLFDLRSLQEGEADELASALLRAAGSV